MPSPLGLQLPTAAVSPLPSLDGLSHIRLPEFRRAPCRYGESAKCQRHHFRTPRILHHSGRVVGDKPAQLVDVFATVEEKRMAGECIGVGGRHPGHLVHQERGSDAQRDSKLAKGVAEARAATRSQPASSAA